MTQFGDDMRAAAVEILGELGIDLSYVLPGGTFDPDTSTVSGGPGATHVVKSSPVLDEDDQYISGSLAQSRTGFITCLPTDTSGAAWTPVKGTKVTTPANGDLVVVRIQPQGPDDGTVAAYILHVTGSGTDT